MLDTMHAKARNDLFDAVETLDTRARAVYQAIMGRVAQEDMIAVLDAVSDMRRQCWKLNRFMDSGLHASDACGPHASDVDQWLGRYAERGENLDDVPRMGPLASRVDVALGALLAIREAMEKAKAEAKQQAAA